MKRPPDTINTLPLVRAAVGHTDPWEAAYLRFETPDKEIRKFSKRLIKMGALDWSKEAEIVELFCGRGNGLHALSKLGFVRLEGVDISQSLLAQYSGPGRCHVCDCRQLPFDNCCKDIVVIQGGLHHLMSLPDDLEQCLCEINRVLRADGLLVLVEPWLTPFLSLVHWLCRQSIVRRISGKIDALATMIHYERETYERWLDLPKMILPLLHQYFTSEKCLFRWGKLWFAGRKRAVT